VGIWAEKGKGGYRFTSLDPTNPILLLPTTQISEQYHRSLFRNLRQTLVQQNAWPYGDEGSETEQKEGQFQFQPIRAKDGESASGILLRDRGRN